MAWLKKGLCGVDLRKQTIFIAVLDMVFAAIGLVFGFIIIEDPEKYLGDLNHPVDGEVDVAGHDVVEAADNSTTLAESAQVSAGEVGGSLETQHYQHLVRTVQNKGVELVVGSLITITFSAMLIYGVRKGKSIWFLPWLVQKFVEFFITLGYYIIKAVSGHFLSILDILLFSLFMLVVSYLTYSVLSHYILLRRMDKHSNQVISSVMDGDSYTSSPVNYERLQEEVGKEMSTISVTIPPTPVRDRPDETDHRRDDIMYFSID